MRTHTEALIDFSSELKSMSEWNNTLVLTNSEFGRRVSENSLCGALIMERQHHICCWVGSAGWGGSVTSQSLLELVDDDLRYTMDYRAVYERVLVDGLG